MSTTPKVFTTAIACLLVIGCTSYPPKASDKEIRAFVQHHKSNLRDNDYFNTLYYYDGVSASFDVTKMEQVQEAAASLGLPYEIRREFGDDGDLDGWPYDLRWDAPHPPSDRSWLLVSCSSPFDIERAGAHLLQLRLFREVHPFPIPEGLGDGSTTIFLGATTRSAFFPQINRTSKIEDAHPAILSFLKKYFAEYGTSPHIQLTSTERLRMNYKISEIKNFIFPKKNLWEEVLLSIDFDPAFGEDELYAELDMSGAFASAHGSRASAPSPSKFRRLEWDSRELQNGAERFATSFKQEFHVSTDYDEE